MCMSVPVVDSSVFHYLLTVYTHLLTVRVTHPVSPLTRPSRFTVIPLFSHLSISLFLYVIRLLSTLQLFHLMLCLLLLISMQTIYSSSCTDSASKCFLCTFCSFIFGS